jgi:alkanesulfonate monooxygenase SsuD/methylene tetrahydromethanopterin reductase-like flavin-dependent oxidoreductase (luciferase family)
VYAAGEGPKTLRLSGEVADGTVLTGGTTPERVAEAVALIGEGRRAAGRPEGQDVVVYVAAAFGEHQDARVSAQLERWEMTEEPDRILTGSAAAVASGVEKFYDAGASAVILQPLQDETDLSSFLAEVADLARRVL